MDLYITGTTPYEHIIGDILIPKQAYSREELARGKRSVTVITEEQLETIKDNLTFKELFDQKELVISDKPPRESIIRNVGSSDAMRELELALNEKSEADKKLEALQQELAEAKRQLALDKEKIGELEANKIPDDEE